MLTWPGTSKKTTDCQSKDPSKCCSLVSGVKGFSVVFLCICAVGLDFSFGMSDVHVLVQLV